MTIPRRSSGERMVPTALRSAEDHLLFARHVFAYRLADRDIPHGSQVLEVGTGEEYGTRMLGERRAVIGVDVDPEPLFHAARQRIGNGIGFAQADGGTLPFRAETFDAVVSFQVIEHADDDVRFVLELARVLRHGGVAFLTTPNRALRLAPGERPWNRQHRREYDAEALGTLLGAVFTGVEVVGIGAVPEVHELELARLRRIRRLAALDPFGLHRFLPASVAAALRSAAHRLWLDRRPAASSAAALRQPSPDDYLLTALSTGKALDLLAVCRGPSRQD